MIPLNCDGDALDADISRLVFWWFKLVKASLSNPQTLVNTLKVALKFQVQALKLFMTRLGVPYLGVLIIRILLFRVPY